jgi:hypothetical protein
MKIGVSTIPWGKTKLPRRAELEESVARMENGTGGREIGQNSLRAKPNHEFLAAQKNYDFTETSLSGQRYPSDRIEICVR